MIKTYTLNSRTKCLFCRHVLSSHQLITSIMVVLTYAHVHHFSISNNCRLLYCFVYRILDDFIFHAADINLNQDQTAFGLQSEQKWISYMRSIHVSWVRYKLARLVTKNQESGNIYQIYNGKNQIIVFGDFHEKQVKRTPALGNS